ncbi:tripartite motif-containing protein 2-like [Mytilus edulis]|uniref:tripartite motif-containing protein 2-like n=1 Tax=Mytilus edulis TaxID=6550 RepID=UPI0039EF055C
MATSSVEDELICALCLEIYSDPRLLPCYHTFCKTCIEQLVNKGEEKGKFKFINCPLCRSTIKSTEFPSNIYIQTRVTFNNKITKCDLCESDENITVKCIDCDQFLCENCSSVHRKIKTCKDHKVIEYTKSETLNENPTFKITKNSFCTIHKEEILRFHCIQCEEPVCRDCKITSHDGHKFEDLQNRVQNASDWISSYSNGIDLEVGYISNKVHSILNLKNELDKHVLVVQQSLNDAEEQLCREVKEGCAKIRSEINQLKDEQVSVINEKKIELDALISKMTIKKRYIDSVVSSGTDSDIVMYKKQMSKGTDICMSTSKLVIHMPTYSADRSIIKLGQIMEKQISLQLEPKVKLKNAFLINIMNKSVSAIRLRNKDEALITFRSDAWNQGSRVKNVLAYYSSGIVKESYFLPPQMDLLIDKHGRIYFYEDRLKHIEGGLSVYLKPDEENKTENIYPCKRPVSMETLSNGDFIILDIENKLSRINFDKKIQICSFEEGHLTSPISVASGRDNKIWVADPGSGQVIAFNNDGKLQFKFDVCKTSTLISQKSRPNSICFCKAFNVAIVADSLNNCIFTISEDGRSAEIILDETLESPSCVACTDNILWVCDKRNRISIYEILI